MKKKSEPNKPLTKAQEKKLIKKTVNKAFSLWGGLGRLICGNKCELCGCADKEIKENGKPTVLNAHHIIIRDNHVLRFNPRNCIILCQWDHKFGRTGAHRGTIIFNEWFRNKRKDDYYYLLDRYEDDVIESLQDAELAVEMLKCKIAKTLGEKLCSK